MQTSEQFLRRLIAKGRGAASRGDAIAWRGAYAALECTDDRHVRLAGELALGKILIDAPSRTNARLALTAAGAALADLEREAAEPARWALLGRLLARLGQRDAAAACEDAARTLEPKQVGQRVVAGERVKAARPLAARALKAARSVQAPIAAPRLSVVMIVRDEEAALAACLASVTGVADELVIVDTGSLDGTMEIARGFGATVLERPWDGSFANARNAGLEHATGDWVFVLDADERLCAEDVPALRRAIAKPWREALQVNVIHSTRHDGVGPEVSSSGLRLWRHRPSVRFEGIVHEQVRGLPRFLPERFEQLDVRLQHDGYREHVIKAKGKRNRNRTLLERQVADADGTPQAFTWFNLGVEYLGQGDLEDGLGALENALAAAELEGGIRALPIGPMLVVRLTVARRLVGDAKRAECSAAGWLREFPGHTDLAIERAQCAAVADPARGLALLEDAIALGDGPPAFSSTVGIESYVGLTLRGDFLVPLGRLGEAIESYRLGLATNPGFVGGIGGLARALLEDGTPPADVLSELGPLARDYLDGAGALLAAAFLGAGALVQAELVFNDMLVALPGSPEARVGLASCALARGDTASAAAYCDPLPDGAPETDALLRCALFCALAEGDVVRADGILVGPQVDRLAAEHAEVYTAWRDTLTARPSAALSVVAARAALEILGNAVKLTRLESCDVLYALIAGSALPAAEAHQGLAEQFISGGYVDIAAGEWLALLEEDGPTGPVLLGLAQVALERGDHEDALALAHEAAELDPELAVAAQELRVRAAASTELAPA